MPRAAAMSEFKKIILLLVLGTGLAASYLSSTTATQQVHAFQQTQADHRAQQLTASFTSLLNAANGPLRSLATLFNGSGRVSAKEFADTIEFIGQQGAPMPGGLGFLIPSEAGGCETTDCWVVAYSTVADGLLKPGADVSRFDPTRATISAALSQPDTLKLGPAFHQATGEQSSFCAVTIKNTRQFGVLVSRVDYATLINDLYERWAISGMVLRLEAAFPDGEALTDYRFIYGGPDPTPAAVHSITLPAAGSGAQFKLTWDVLPEFSAGPAMLLPRATLVAGIALTLLAVLGLWVWFTGRAPPKYQKDQES